MEAAYLVMPMAGRGSRFAKQGEPRPKPLIDLIGRPFFWWATESVLRSVPVGQIVFVVLEEHCRAFQIDQAITSFYPDATIVCIPNVTGGALESAELGVAALRGNGKLIVNDCDHAFTSATMPAKIAQLGSNAAANLLCFRSDKASYSYARVDAVGNVTGTVEKEVVSPYAIAGCYAFASATQFTRHAAVYKRNCPYDELFVSGIMNSMLDAGERLSFSEVEAHFSFGTPEEKSSLDLDRFKAALPWDRA